MDNQIIIPKSQVDIIIEALEFYQKNLSELNPTGANQQSNHKEFDCLTLKAILNSSDVSIIISSNNFENFTHINGVDFPLYI